LFGVPRWRPPRLSPGYGLASGGFPDKVVKAVLKEATSGPLKIERLYEITRKRQPETEKKLS
jgi:hypothetical protein